MAARPQNLSRRSVVIAGWSSDESGARQQLGSDDGAVRASAVSALARMGALSIPDLLAAIADGAPEVRCRALGARSWSVWRRRFCKTIHPITLPPLIMVAPR